jgi:hypothetical protein
VISSSPEMPLEIFSNGRGFFALLLFVFIVDSLESIPLESWLSIERGTSLFHSYYRCVSINSIRLVHPD